MTTKSEALEFARLRLDLTKQPQVVYQSQPERFPCSAHFLYCSVAAYRSQCHLTPKFVEILGLAHAV